MKNDKSIANCILSINGGSSSIKFALYETAELLTQIVSGKVENIGKKNAKFHFRNSLTNQENSVEIQAFSYEEAADFLIDWIGKQNYFSALKAVGHRIVHGLKHTQPVPITSELRNELKKMAAFAPEHLPNEIRLVEAFAKRYPALAQVACFDTSFHVSMLPVAKLLTIPRRFFEMGVQRYGFHGLSYAYLIEELAIVAGNEAAQGKIIVAHLGNGASLAAIKNKKSVDCSMGFTPNSGLPMSTRTGDLEPGAAWYVMQTENLNPAQFNALVNHESGLLGVSETTADLRELMNLQRNDPRAAEAVELFCYQTKKWIGAFAAVLEGVDTLLFSGGIGENNAEIRARICRGLAFLGIEIEEKRNENQAAIISTATSRVTVRVMKTNEELMIARLVCQVLK